MPSGIEATSPVGSARPHEMGILDTGYIPYGMKCRSQGGEGDAIAEATSAIEVVLNEKW